MELCWARQYFLLCTNIKEVSEVIRRTNVKFFHPLSALFSAVLYRCTVCVSVKLRVWLHVTFIHQNLFSCFIWKWHWVLLYIKVDLWLYVGSIRYPVRTEYTGVSVYTHVWRSAVMSYSQNQAQCFWNAHSTRRRVVQMFIAVDEYLLKLVR